MDSKDFEGLDFLSLYDWSREKIEYVFKVAEKMETIVKNRTRIQLLADKIIAIIFYQPSTRTRTSFQSAALRLGGGVVGWESGTSSRSRDQIRITGVGETDKDVAMMLDSYADAIIVRHDTEGAVKEMAKWATVPVLNAGDGLGLTSEHPSQGLLDIYTIKKEQGKIDGITICEFGERAAKTRGAHSLKFGLAKYDDVKVYICCPPESRLSPKEEKPLNELNLNYEYVDDIEDVIREIDVLQQHSSVEGYTLNASMLKGVKDNLIIMHQLPRGVGIALDVDDTKYARYFQEAWNGVPIRMALLSLVFGREL